MVKPSLWPITVLLCAALVLIGLRHLTGGASVLLLFAGAWYAFLLTKREPKRRSLDMALVVLALLMGSSVMAWTIGTLDTHTLGRAEAFQYALILGAIAPVCLRMQTLTHEEVQDCASALFNSVALYAIVNVLAYFVFGLRSPSETFRLADTSWLSLLTRACSFRLRMCPGRLPQSQQPIVRPTRSCRGARTEPPTFSKHSDLLASQPV